MHRQDERPAHRPMFDQFAGGEKADAQPPPPRAQAPRAPAGQRAAGTRRPARPQAAATAKRPAQRNTPARRRTAQSGTRRRVQGGQRVRKRHYAVVTLLLVLALVGTLVFTAYNIISKNLSGKNTGQGVLPDAIQTLPEYTGAGIVNFLVCGIDYDDESASGYTSEDKVGRTDMILYVHYDTVAGKVSILQLPRDIYVGDEASTGGTGKINALYFHAKDTSNRMAALATVIYEQYKLPVDFYVTIDMDAVKDLIDHGTGPIEVYVPIDVVDDESGAVLAAGWRWFTGDEAEFYLRNRNSSTYGGQGDVARLQMQQYFYSALYREFTQLAPADLLMWMQVLLHRVKTDMTDPADLVQLGGLAQKALSLEGSDITFIRPAVSGAYHNGQSLLSLVDDEFAELLNEYFRPEGRSYPVEELDIRTLPVIDTMGINEASIRTMGDIQESEAARA